MNSQHYPSGSWASRMLATIIAIALAGALAARPAFGQACVPVSNAAINTNGIVFGAFGAMGGCVADAGWGGVIAKKMLSGGGGSNLNDPQVLITGFNSNNDGMIDKIYIGVHVQVDETFDDKDKLLLVFDATGNGDTFSDDDFGIVIQPGTNPPPVGTEQCGQLAGSVAFYKGAAMASAALPPETSIKVRRAWDYDPVIDPEQEIWEVEIELDVASLGLKAPVSGNAFRFGARLVVQQSVNGTEVWRWPSNFPNDINFLHIEPASVAGLTAATLAQCSFGNCADVVFEPDPLSGVSAWNSSGQPNAFTRLTPADFSGGIAQKKNHFRAAIKFFSPANPADASAVAVPNTGKVRFILKPWNMGFINPFTMGEMPVSFTHLNEVQTKDLFWPITETEYNAHKADIDATPHACLEVRLVNFTVNMNESADFVQKNLLYTTASTIRDTIVLSAEGQRLPEGQTEFEYMLRARWRNLPGDIAKGWSYKVENADKLGIKDDGNGIFRVKLAPKERKLVAVAITGGKMPVDPVEFAVSAKAGGKRMPTPSGEDAKVVEVKEGKMVTIVATGGVTVDAKKENQQNGADGYSDEKMQRMKFLLPGDHYSPWQNVGALIGSFDEFKTAFVVGNTMTFIVPKGADKLWLAVNDIDGGYDDNRGGFNLSMIMTEPLSLPTSVAATGGTFPGMPPTAQTAANLPELDFEAFNMVRVKEAEGFLLDPAGYVAFAVYHSHQEGDNGVHNGGDTARPDTTKPAPGCACGAKSPRAGGFMGMVPVMMLIGGGGWLYRRARGKGRREK